MGNKTKIVVIGDNTTKTYDYAVKKYSKSTLVTIDNFNEAHRATSGVYHISAYDITNMVRLSQFLLSCDVIDYCPECNWDKSSYQYVATCVACNNASHALTVLNYTVVPRKNLLSSKVERTTNEPTLFSFGCSHTLGEGLVNPESEAYSNILAKMWDMPLNMVAKKGAGISWSARHIVSNIDIFTPNDIILWYCSTLPRMSILEDLESLPEERMLVECKEKHHWLSWTDEQLYLNFISTVESIVALARAKNLKLLVWGSVQSDTPAGLQTNLDLSTFKESVPLSSVYPFDFGTDGVHAGPVTHQVFVNLINDRARLLGYV